MGGRADNRGCRVTYNEAFKELNVDGKKCDEEIWKV